MARVLNHGKWQLTIAQWEVRTEMADDRMRNDDLDRNMGGAGKDKDNFGQQTPGRNKQDDDLRTGQRGAGQGHDQENEPGHMKDDFGTSGNKGQGQGGQNRGNI
jgi:hypothetical protein